MPKAAAAKIKAAAANPVGTLLSEEAPDGIVAILEGLAEGPALGAGADSNLTVALGNCVVTPPVPGAILPPGRFTGDTAVPGDVDAPGGGVEAPGGGAIVDAPGGGVKGKVESGFTGAGTTGAPGGLGAEGAEGTVAVIGGRGATGADGALPRGRGAMGAMGAEETAPTGAGALGADGGRTAAGAAGVIGVGRPILVDSFLGAAAPGNEGLGGRLIRTVCRLASA